MSGQAEEEAAGLAATPPEPPLSPGEKAVHAVSSRWRAWRRSRREKFRSRTRDGDNWCRLCNGWHPGPACTPEDEDAFVTSSPGYDRSLTVSGISSLPAPAAEAEEEADDASTGN